jgi:hypothetical protein
MKIAITTEMPPTLAGASGFLSALSFLYAGIEISTQHNEGALMQWLGRPPSDLLKTLEQAGYATSVKQWHIQAEDAYLISGLINRIASKHLGPTFRLMQGGSLDVEIGHVLDTVGGWLRRHILVIQDYVNLGPSESRFDDLLKTPELEASDSGSTLVRGLLRYAYIETYSALGVLKAKGIAIY